MRTFEQLKEIFMDATPETWHQHKNGGGWVRNHVKIDETVFVGENAIISGGVISGTARISGGVISGGVISGTARISGGVISGGEWNCQPLHICGTRFSLSNCKPGHIQIGCHCLTYDEWLEKGEAIADDNNFTAEEKAEYRAYIELFKKIGK